MKLYSSQPIRRAMQQPHVTLDTVAGDAGLNRSSVQAVVAERSVTVDTLSRVCRALNVDIRELFEVRQ